MKVCSVPGCPELVPCPTHPPKRKKDERPSAAQRGYGARWRAFAKRYLRCNPICRLCGAPSEVPDHWPVKRRDLVAMGAPDPDAEYRLRPLCIRCHNRETAKEK